MWMIIVIFSLALFLASVAGVWMKEKDIMGSIMALFIAYVLMVMGAVITCFEYGYGTLKMSRLERNAVYEVLSSVPDNGKYVAILRDQDGDLSACLLTTDPPKTFKVTGANGDTYQSFPTIVAPVSTSPPSSK